MQGKGKVIKRLENAAFDERFRYYIGLASSTDPVEALNNRTALTLPVLRSLRDEQWTFRYAEGKWSVAELVQHVIDTERIMSTRALRFTRGEHQVLSGFDHSAYVANSEAGQKSPELLLTEYQAVRAATIALFSGMTTAQLNSEGAFGDSAPVKVKEIGMLMAGHDAHHHAILLESYLS